MAVVAAGTDQEGHVITPLPLAEGQSYNYTAEWKSGDPEPEPAPLICVCFQTLRVENHPSADGNFRSS